MLKKIYQRVYIILRAIWLFVFHGMIEIDDNGFWQRRQSPTRSLRKAAMIFDRMGGSNIIEIGTGLHGSMSGNSILVWVSKTKAKKIIALDLEEKHINDVREATASYDNVEALLQDGLEFLKTYDRKIDLLFLDFWTPDTAGQLSGSGRSDSYFEAYKYAKDKMSKESLILIDDTDHIHPWKHTKIVPEARKDGFKVLWEGRQTLLKR